MVEYRVAAAAEHPALIEILTHAFASDAQAYTHFFERAGHDNLRVALRNDEVVGTATLIDMGMFFGGRSVSLTGVAGVGVRADCMRQGVASTMMRNLVGELADRGIALSALYASTASLYRKAGYEAAGTRSLATMLAREIPFAEREGTTRTPTVEDETEIQQLYRAFAQRTPGFLDRGPYVWPRVTQTRFGVPAHGLVVEYDGTIEGYVYYRKVRGQGDRHHLHVTDMVGATPRAIRRIWTVLRDMGTMLDSIVIPTSTTDPFQLALPDPRHRLELHERWFLRIAKLPAAIAQRGWPSGLTATLELDVADEIVPANAGRWIVRIENGQGLAERGGSGKIEITARGLASLYAGYASASTLSLLGLLRASPADLDRLAAPFGGPEPWLRDHF